MEIIKYKLGKKYPERGCVLALGFFDGVHLGHRVLISHTVEKARKMGVPAAVFTFAYGSGLKEDSRMLYSEKERSLLLADAGIDVCFVADFEELRSLSPEQFVAMTVLRDIGASLVSAGYDYRFGYKGSGDADLLSRLMKAASADATIFEAFTFGNEPVSSTRVRSALEKGGVAEANMMLGVPYFISGTVEHGRGDGAKFGYPTLNVSAHDGCVRMRHGVYLTKVKIGKKLYTGLTNVGECPSFGKRKYHTETFLTDFDGDVYGKEIKVYFLGFVRDEKVFSSAEELSEQIKKDRISAEKMAGEIKWQEIGLV